ncbi:hypothetical protein MTR67_018268 [Solanum verrucosum]|uniref:Uncharacterized protein n=1 Tax=Solanum verrucosum TaxID=315347 RepID=A0AAF0QKN7_SOLVR|nr:hypothetical protein MTR67_018268 [Solanum verrucosum]
MFKACVFNFKGNWDDHQPLIEFAYNNSDHSSIGPELVHKAMENVLLIRERLETTQSRQKSYAEVRRRDLEIENFTHEG